MAILETEVEITLGARNISHYESLGYHIPRKKDSRGRMSIVRGAVITVNIIDLTVGGDVRLTKICDDCGGHTREQYYKIILRSRDVDGVDRCLPCAQHAMSLRKAKSGNNLVTKHPEVVALWHPTLNGSLKPDEIVPGSNRKRWWMCNEDGCNYEWRALVQHVTRGTRCPSCSLSKGERKIREYLQFLGYNYSLEETMHGLTGKGGGDLRFDAAIKYDNGYVALLIEFDGIGHFEPTDFAGEGVGSALEQFRIQQTHDRRKNEYARLHNIPLLRIAYTDIDDTERLINEALAKVLRGDQIPC